MWSSRRWTGVLLAASLAVNLFLVGVWVGDHVFSSLRPTPRGGIAPAAQVRRLAPVERARFSAAMKPFRPAIRAARGRVRAARAQVVDDIAAPVLDRARLEGDLAALRQAVQDQQASQHAGLAAAVLSLSPASRATLAERVEGKRAAGPEGPA